MKSKDNLPATPEVLSSKLEALNKLKARSSKIGSLMMSERDDAQAWRIFEGGARQYDLEERTFRFAQNVRTFVRRLNRTLSNVEDARQVIRSSGSVGANYIEACEALSKKDLAMRMKICRKEAKESRYWLRLLYVDDPSPQLTQRDELVQEAHELTSIFGSIVSRYE